MIDPEMPFGKHYGEPLSKVPTNYLRWLLAEADLEDWLRAAVEREYARRPPPPQRSHQRPAPPADWPAVLRQWHREMVLRFHPDRGGSHQAMVAINAAYERLQELTRAC